MMVAVVQPKGQATMMTMLNDRANHWALLLPALVLSSNNEAF